MRIFSDYKDYYDNISVIYDDTDVMWERKKEFKSINIYDNDKKNFGINYKIESKLKEIYLQAHKIGLYHGYYWDGDIPIILGFCGKFYLYMICITHNKYGYHECIKPYLDISKYLNEYGDTDDIKKFNKLKGFTKDKKIIVNDVQNWNLQYHTFKNIDDIFIELNTPIFILKNSLYNHIEGRGYNLIINPKLQHYMLQKEIVPIVAYQEINMYLSNVLAPSNIVNTKLADNVIRDKHGFNNESFRKSKG